MTDRDQLVDDKTDGAQMPLVLAVAEAADKYVSEFDNHDEGGQEQRWNALCDALEAWHPAEVFQVATGLARCVACPARFDTVSEREAHERDVHGVNPEPRPMDLEEQS
jgi:hypothetical protein